MFGAGHVGAACVSALSMLDARIDLIDSRSGVLAAAYPTNVQALETADPALLAAASPARYYLVMTHDHALDLDICVRLLQRTDIAYCGLIGSVSKRRRFEKRFRALGLSENDISALTCPVGIGEISGKKPAEIAIGVAAQLLQIHERVAMPETTPARRRRGQESRICRLKRLNVSRIYVGEHARPTVDQVDTCIEH